MNEFGKVGIPFSKADDIYYTDRKEINSLHNSGMPANQIVGLIIDGKSKNEGTESDSPGVYSINKKFMSLTDVITGSLRAQIELSGHSLRDNTFFTTEEPLFAVDEYVCGYIFGFSTGIFQRSFENFAEYEAQCLASIAAVFQDLFGFSGLDLFSKSLNIQLDESFRAGSSAAGEEAFRLFVQITSKNSDECPHLLADYLRNV